jgi:hypothetical protein
VDPDGNRVEPERLGVAGDLGQLPQCGGVVAFREVGVGDEHAVTQPLRRGACPLPRLHEHLARHVHTPAAGRLLRRTDDAIADGGRDCWGSVSDDARRRRGWRTLRCGVYDGHTRECEAGDWQDQSHW